MSYREWETAIAGLPIDIAQMLREIPEIDAGKIQEIRLRANAPISLSTPSGELIFKHRYIMTAAMLEECFFRLCDYSVHTHQQELKQGFITAKGGCRVGVAGTAVTDNGHITSIRGVTSLCIRVAREHSGAAAKLARRLSDSGELRGTLICGAPSSGKTSILRDLARGLAEGRYGQKGRCLRVSVVDERGELSGGQGLSRCDVLCGFPKDAGIQQAVRCLAPDVILFDELGSSDEVRAVMDSLNSGVSVIATAHINSGGNLPEALLLRPPVRHALESGAFEQIAVLSGREKPGHVRHLFKVSDIYGEGNRTGACRTGGRGYGLVCIGGTVAEGAQS